MINAYAQAGVSVDIEAKASRIMYEASKETFANRKRLIGEVVAPFDDFAGLKAVAVGALPAGSFMSMGFDTVGTKAGIAQRIGKHDTIAYDLLAMVCDDAVMRGGEPVLVGSNLDIKSLGSNDRSLPIIRELAAGYVAAAKAANVAIINGEIAQMGDLMTGWGDFPYHWGAACVWFARKEKMFTGLEIQAGDSIVALREPGFRTNGLTLARRIFQERYGKEWHMVPFGSTTVGEAALLPAIIYARLILKLYGGFASKSSCAIHGVAHITGGGVPEKLGRVLRRSGLGAHLTNLFEPGDIMRYAQEIGSISDIDAYRAWNMGQGMLIITPEPEKVIAEAARFDIEARVAGEITVKSDIRIVSKGIDQTGAELIF